MPSRTPYTDLLHNQGALITRHPFPEGDEHPFDPEIEDDIAEVEARERDTEIPMSNEQLEGVLYLNQEDVLDSDESQEWQIEQVNRGVNAR